MRRLNVIKRRLDSITHKALADALKRLEHNGLVIRTGLPTAPISVEYRIILLGISVAEATGMKPSSFMTDDRQTTATRLAISSATVAAAPTTPDAIAAYPAGQRGRLPSGYRQCATSMANPVEFVDHDTSKFAGIDT